MSSFDFSPAERFQLMEDHGDTFAGSPEPVLGQDWQREELARRKANLMKCRASNLPWDETKHRGRNHDDR